ncbi:hypothetical protein A3K86_18130 [Photobacterium jeanii]|uniref:Major facilitator superfamily (MFS) profile domain-containing protein n=1 Tax=Photobacterium jeanii TaxID=858640 RepID=A0A178K0P9_9GAMM|nr:MFS transporter [Photobacterium jeanii]OAN10908.1 hypothetical protein A3K86_18130 [Photobacterium jeanii]PST90423.1 MFS transporter [Photobacterium jeanii]
MDNVTPCSTNKLGYQQWFCFLIYFLVALDSLVVVPFSASMALDTVGSSAYAGYLVSAYAVSAAVVCLFVRGTQHHINEQRKINIALTGITLMTLITAHISDFYLLLIVRVITGGFGGILAVRVLNYVLLISSDEQKKRNLALLFSSFPLALALGVPCLIFLSSTVNWQQGFSVLGAVLIGVALLAIFVVFNTRNGQPAFTSKPTLELSNNAKPHRQLWRLGIRNNSQVNNRKIVFSALILVAAVLSTFTVSTQFPVLLITNLHIKSELLSSCYTVSGVGAFVLMQAYARKPFHQKAVMALVWFCSLLMVTTLVMGFEFENLHLAAFAFCLFVVVSSARTLVVSTELITGLNEVERPIFISLQNALQHISIAIGGAVGSVFVMVEIHSQQLDFSMLVYVASALILLVPVLWVRFINYGD